jgi:hypothetical protein
MPRVEGHAVTEEYRRKSDEELAQLEAESAQLTAEADAILREELARRDLKAESLKSKANQATSACLDDFPKMARTAARQEFLKKWYRPVALDPFTVVKGLVKEHEIMRRVARLSLIGSTPPGCRRQAIALIEGFECFSSRVRQTTADCHPDL